MQKIKDFVSKYWAILVGVITFVLGFITGKRIRGTSADYGELRRNLEELITENKRLRSEIDGLRELAQERKELSDALERELNETGLIITEARREAIDLRWEIELVGSTNERLRSWILKYREEIEKIPAVD